MIPTNGAYVNRVANSEDPGQSTPRPDLAQLCLSKNLRSLRYLQLFVPVRKDSGMVTLDVYLPLTEAEGETASTPSGSKVTLSRSESGKLFYCHSV